MKGYLASFLAETKRRKDDNYQSTITTHPAFVSFVGATPVSVQNSNQGSVGYVGSSEENDHLFNSHIEQKPQTLGAATDNTDTTEIIGLVAVRGVQLHFGFCRDCGRDRYISRPCAYCDERRKRMAVVQRKNN